MNICPTCDEDFGSVSAFDAHRVGKYLQRGSSEYMGPLADWKPGKGRRCLTVEELIGGGWTRDGRGRWRRPSEGAPWALSQNQVTAQTRRNVPRRPSGRSEPRRRSTQLPDSRKAEERR
jgi:hypothetical protein